MIEQVMMLASYGFSGGTAIGDMLGQWEQAGFFSYLLPFLLIFALVFGVLSTIKIFDQSKGINAIIALVVGLMAMQSDMVSQFFSAIFPRMGVGLAIILVLLILAGLFIDPSKGGITMTLLGIGVVVAIIVFVQTAGAVGWSSGSWWVDNWPMIAGVIFLLVVIGIIVGGSKPGEGNYRPLAWYPAQGHR